MNAAGVSFLLLGADQTQLQSSKPVVSIGATRTGAGKSQTARKVCRELQTLGLRVVPVRHPMPYGNLVKQAVQRFASHQDLADNACTIEEREEYEPYLESGFVVYAGVDYERILRQSEQEADIIVWDGGNNDIPFFKSDFHIVVADPHRPGHELTYYPGEINARMADVFLINKVDTASPQDVLQVHGNLHKLNPSARILEAASPISVQDADAIRGKRVLVVEDGPTLTHGGLSVGAGWLAAQRFGAARVVDPRPFAVGSLRDTYNKFPTIGDVLPAMGYGRPMIEELEQTINDADADTVIVGTPIDLGRFLHIDRPLCRARYELHEIGKPSLHELLKDRFAAGQQ